MTIPDSTEDVEQLEGSIDVHRIIGVCASHFGLKPEQLRSRAREIILVPRRVTMYLVVMFADLSLDEIARELGVTARTIIRSYHTVCQQIERDPEIKGHVVRLISRLFAENVAVSPGLGSPDLQRFIILACSQYFVIREDVLLSRDRRMRINRARQVLMYLVCECTDLTYAEIGQQVVHRDHSTIRYTHRKIQQLLNEREPFVSRAVHRLLPIIRSRIAT